MPAKPHLVWPMIAALLLFAVSVSLKAQDKAPSTTPAPAAAEDGEAVIQPDTHWAAVSAQWVIKVIHVDKTRQSLTAKAKELGGFPTLVTDEQLVLKVPRQQLSAFLAAADQEGFILNKELRREDLDLPIAQLEGAVRSKMDILTRLRSFFSGADVAGTVRIEREMVAIVEELEQVQGQLRLAKERARYAVVAIHFRFPKRESIISVESPFEWINTADLDRFLSEY